MKYDIALTAMMNISAIAPRRYGSGQRLGSLGSRSRS
jgi:hypothetical protein